jgi:serine/threonine protein kinase
MSPEQVRAQETDHRTGIFSFGAVLCEMLAGRRTFSKADGSRNDERDSERRAAGDFAAHAKSSTRSTTDRRSLSGEKSGAGFSIRLRPRIRFGCPFGRAKLDGPG